MMMSRQIARGPLKHINVPSFDLLRCIFDDQAGEQREFHNISVLKRCKIGRKWYGKASNHKKY
jgi:hypothetical protein